MRERTNSDDTELNLVVYGESGMAKESVGARVPVAIADQVFNYVDTHEITRTEAIELFIRTALEDPDQFQRKQSYTVQIRQNQDEDEREKVSAGDWRDELRAADRFGGEWDSTEALVARLPGDVVAGIENWAESQDLAKSVAAEDLLIRGLKADPLPESNPDPVPEHMEDDYSEARVKTVELEPEDAELFRRCRLWYKKGPSEAVNWLISATYSTSNARVGWAKPDETDEE